MPKSHGGRSSGEQIPTKRRKKDSDELNSIKIHSAENVSVFIPTRKSQFPQKLNTESSNIATLLHTSKSTLNHAQRDNSVGLHSKPIEINNGRLGSDCRELRPNTQNINNGKWSQQGNFKGGAILHISLKNFMNHSKLDWSPINRVNIITGPNGAGKSSILSAIVLGLGGNARYMKRHSNVGKFVQKQTNKAEIRITISNRGDDAYKYDTYGGEIIFERIIYAAGHSIHNIRRGDTNAVVCSAKLASEERGRILDHFNIALDNPVTILHQEQAKTFFSQEDTEKNLWEFVMASTQMKSIQDEYRDSKTQLDLAKNQLDEKRKHIDDAKQELTELSKKEDAFKKFQFNSKEKFYKEMIKWGWANDCRGKYELIKKQREEKDRELERLENDLEGWKASLQDMNERKRHLELENEQFNEKARIKLEELEQLKGNRETLLEELIQVESELKAINKKQGEKRGLKKKLEYEKKKAATLNGRYAMQTRNKKQTLEEKLDKLETSKNEISTEITRLGGERNDKEIEGEELSKQKKELREKLKSKIKEQTHRKNFLSKFKTQSLSRYGEQILELQNKIDDYLSSPVFNKPPIGPLGRYIKFKGEASNDQQLAELLEVELGRNILKSYICDCRADRIQLETIMREIWSHNRGKPPIIFTRKFSNQRYSEIAISKYSVDVSGNVGLYRIMDFLDFENDNVFNLIVDEKHIERILVVTTNQVETLFAERETVPKNTKYAISRDKYRYFPPSYVQNYSSYYIPFNKNGAALLVNDFREEERQNQHGVEKVNFEITEIHNNINRISSTEVELKTTKQKIIREQEKLKEEIRQVLMEITKVREEIREEAEDTKTIEEMIR